MGVEVTEVGAGEVGCDSVPNPLEGGDIAEDGASVVGRRVDEDLTGPEVEEGNVDLGPGPVTQLGRGWHGRR